MSQGMMKSINHLHNFLALSFVFGFIVFASAACYADTSFSPSDLQGTWYGCALSTGTNFGWYFSTTTFDNAGNFSRSITNNLNQNINQKGTDAVDNNGIITNLDNPSTHGIMNSNKNIIITTFGKKGSYVLRISVKGGGAFSTADLQGTWYVHIMRVGSSKAGAGYGTLTCDSSGNCSLVDQNGNAHPAVLNVSSNGIITEPGDPSFHGLMSSDKNFAAYVSSHNDGSVELGVIVGSGVLFSTSDLLGTWYSHLLSIGGGQAAGWGFGTAIIDAAGNLMETETASDRSVSNTSLQLNISSNGILTIASDPSFHGVMSNDKTLEVNTEGSTLNLSVKGNSLASQYAVTVSKSGAGSGTVTSSPAGINCGSTCSASINSNTAVTLTAAPAPGDGFVGWSGGGWGCSGSQGDCTFGLTTDSSVTANFAMQDFTDVPIAPPFYSYIEAIYQAGITHGCGNGNYCPSMTVARDQMAAFIVRALHGDNPVCNGGIPCSSTTPYFVDVTPLTDPVFFKYIQKLYEDGITTGCGNGNYCPSMTVTRDQMAAFMVRAAQVQAGHNPEGFSCSGGADCATTTRYFIDVPSSDFFFKYVQKLYENGITVGCGNGNYCPTENVTRDQMAAFLSRAFLGME